jgi:hypothetical protein
MGYEMADKPTDLLRAYFDQIESQVQFGDTKASLLVAGDALLLPVAGGLIEVVSGCHENYFGLHCVQISPSLVLAVAAGVLLVVSLACALRAARPSGKHRKPPAELFLISHIASLDVEQYAKTCLETPNERLAEEALRTVHGKARYATRKFGLLRRAIDAALWGLGFMASSVIAAVAARSLP